MSPVTASCEPARAAANAHPVLTTGPVSINRSGDASGGGEGMSDTDVVELRGAATSLASTPFVLFCFSLWDARSSI